MKKLMTVEEIAEFLDVNMAWVYREGSKHGLPLVRVGRFLRGRPEEIERWLNQQRV